MVETRLKGENNLSDRTERYLTFYLSDEEYGLEIKKIREIIRPLCITFVPQCPPYLKGVINLRGKVVAIIDLRLRFGMPECELTEKSCIIVVEFNEELVGIMVDAVSEVADIAAKEVEETTFLNQQVNERFIRGIGNVDGKIKILINVEEVLAYNEL